MPIHPELETEAMLRSKFFRIALEGITTDGRKITRQTLEQMARNYDRAKYGARVWLEHMRGFLPDGPFGAYGDVAELQTREDDGKVGLFARIEPTPELVELNRRRQKIFTSMEVDYEFADSGEAYLIGLGVTDSPASLGTEAMAFSASVDHSLFEGRKQRPENVFSTAMESDLEFVEEPDDDQKPGLFARIKELLGKNTDDADKRFTDIDAAVMELADTIQGVAVHGVSANAGQPTDGVSQSAFDALKSAHKALLSEFTALKERLEQEESADNHHRKPASGGNGGDATDC